MVIAVLAGTYNFAYDHGGGKLKVYQATKDLNLEKLTETAISATSDMKAVSGHLRQTLEGNLLRAMSAYSTYVLLVFIPRNFSGNPKSRNITFCSSVR